MSRHTRREGNRHHVEVDCQTLDEALDAAGVGLWAWQIGSSRLCSSPTARHLLGLSDERLESWAEVIFDGDLPRVLDAVAGALAGKTYETEYRVEGSDGTLRTVAVRGSVVAEPDGSELFVGALVEATARTEATMAIAESEGRLQAALACSGAAAWEWIVDDGVVLCSDGFELVLGWEPGGFDGRVDSLLSRLEPVTAADLLRGLSEAAEGRPLRVAGRTEPGGRAVEFRGGLATGRGRPEPRVAGLVLAPGT